MENENNKLILVYYVSISNIPLEEQENVLKKVYERAYLDKDLIPNLGATLVVPTIGDNRIECINPVYITDMELIKKHERLMAELHESMNNYISNTNKNE